MTEAHDILKARADELRLELTTLDTEIKQTRSSVDEAEKKLIEGKAFLNNLRQERNNMRARIQELEQKAEALL